MNFPPLGRVGKAESEMLKFYSIYVKFLLNSTQEKGGKKGSRRG